MLSALVRAQLEDHVLETCRLCGVSVDTADIPIGSDVGGIEDGIANLPLEYRRRGPVEELAKVWVAVNQMATVER